MIRTVIHLRTTQTLWADIEDNEYYALETALQSDQGLNSVNGKLDVYPTWLVRLKSQTPNRPTRYVSFDFREVVGLEGSRMLSSVD